MLSNVKNCRLFLYASLCACLPWSAASAADAPRRTVAELSAGQPETHRRNAQILEGLTRDQMREVFIQELRSDYSRAERFEDAAWSAASLWTTTKQTEYRDLAVNAYLAALGDLAGKPEEFLQQLVTAKGSVEHRNDYQRKLVDPMDLYALRDATWHFAMLYQLTGERSYAAKSAILLARFAKQIPKWPLYLPNRADQETVQKSFPQKGNGFRRIEEGPGLWGIWFYQDLEMGLPLAKAYDVIYASGELQRRGTLESVEAMLRNHIDLQKRIGADYFSNMDAVQWRGMLQFAQILHDPELVHEAVWWLRSLYQTNFYSDGWWHEGSPAYHRQLHGRAKSLAAEVLQGYSDPPGFVSKRDGTRFDNLDILRIMERPFARADAVMANIRLPDGTDQVLGDTHFRPGGSDAALRSADSFLFGARGHAILGTGPGLAQVSLHFGGTHGHEHYDCLNLNLFAKGRELLSETQYSLWEATNSNREWHTMTAGHVTVVVDELSQTGRGEPGTPRRKRQPEDDIPGIPDWPWRWRGHGNSMNDGRLRLFHPEFDRVQVMEADGERSYGSLVSLDRYRRTVALVKINEEDIYVVDIFRIKGGKTHDYMLHSCLDLPHAVKLSIDLPEAGPQTLHKYITKVRRGTTDETWSATFRMDDGSASLQTHMLGAPKTELLLGEAPAMRRLGVAPFLAVRRKERDSVFVAVHHPYREKPLVQKVEALALDPSNDQAVALRVTLPDRVDTIISTPDEGPWPLRRTKDIALRGRFAHVAEGGQRWAYLIDGNFLDAGDLRIDKNLSHEGTLTRASRVEAGDTLDAFHTQTPLPDDGSLNGRFLRVDLGGLLVQTFRIERIERRDKETIIHTSNEPGMTITPGLVKLNYFPGWGIRGQARFHITDSAFLEQK